MNLNEEDQIPLDKVCFTVVTKTRNSPFHHFFRQCSLELDYKPAFTKGKFSKQVFSIYQNQTLGGADQCLFFYWCFSYSKRNDIQIKTVVNIRLRSEMKTKIKSTLTLHKTPLKFTDLQMVSCIICNL